MVWANNIQLVYYGTMFVSSIMPKNTKLIFLNLRLKVAHEPQQKSLKFGGNLHIVMPRP